RKGLPGGCRSARVAIRSSRKEIIRRPIRAHSPWPTHEAHGGDGHQSGKASPHRRSPPPLVGTSRHRLTGIALVRRSVRAFPSLSTSKAGMVHQRRRHSERPVDPEETRLLKYLIFARLASILNRRAFPTLDSCP